jgi:hypothetical protein
MDLKTGNYDTVQFIAELKRLGVVAFQGHGISLNFQLEMPMPVKPQPKAEPTEDDLLFGSSN